MQVIRLVEDMCAWAAQRPVAKDSSAESFNDIFWSSYRNTAL